VFLAHANRLPAQGCLAWHLALSSQEYSPASYELSTAGPVCCMSSCAFDSMVYALLILPQAPAAKSSCNSFLYEYFAKRAPFFICVPYQAHMLPFSSTLSVSMLLFLSTRSVHMPSLQAMLHASQCSHSTLNICMHVSGGLAFKFMATTSISFWSEWSRFAFRAACLESNHSHL
jgi:hypothetical protein